MPGRNNRSKSSFDSQLAISILIFVLLSLLVFWLNRLTGTSLKEFVVEINGMLMDILLFGILMTWLDKKRRSRETIRAYFDQLDDFLSWKSEEGVWRKVGILKRLLEEKVSLPSLRGMELPNAILQDFNLHQADLDQANLQGAFFLDANLGKASFRGANLEKAYMEKTNLLGSDLSNAFAALADLRSSNLVNAKCVCANFEASLFNKSNLAQADCEGANFSMVIFHLANLEAVNFHGARLEGADFREANLSKADFRAADLRETKNITLEQLSKACIDKETELPTHLLKHRRELLEWSAAGDFGPIKTRFSMGIPPFRTRPRGNELLSTKELDYY